MRSRYSAYVVDATSYLFETWAPEHRPALADLGGGQLRWLGLQIVDVENGGINDDAGVVEFIASYRDGPMRRKFHERSRFERRGDQWLYLDGEILG